MRPATIVTNELVEVQRYDYVHTESEYRNGKVHWHNTIPIWAGSRFVTNAEAERLVTGNFTREAYFYHRFDLEN